MKTLEHSHEETTGSGFRSHLKEKLVSQGVSRMTIKKQSLVHTEHQIRTQTASITSLDLLSEHQRKATDSKNSNGGVLETLKHPTPPKSPEPCLRAAAAPVVTVAEVVTLQDDASFPKVPTHHTSLLPPQLE